MFEHPKPSQQCTRTVVWMVPVCSHLSIWRKGIGKGVTWSNEALSNPNNTICPWVVFLEQAMPMLSNTDTQILVLNPTNFSLTMLVLTSMVVSSKLLTTSTLNESPCGWCEYRSRHSLLASKLPIEQRLGVLERFPLRWQILPTQLYRCSQTLVIMKCMKSRTSE